MVQGEGGGGIMLFHRTSCTLYDKNVKIFSIYELLTLNEHESDYREMINAARHLSHCWLFGGV